MSAYRDRLAAGQRERYDQSVARAGALLAAALADLAHDSGTLTEQAA